MLAAIENTIVAISTPPGQGGIAIIRLSGKQAIDIVSNIFVSSHDLNQIPPWKAVLGKIVDHDDEIDQVIVIIYKAPHSYTCEDVVEIHCHGGIYVTRRILELTIQNGARLAQPGEFTLRAFLNGRLDLAQAEAVADLIHAKTEASRRASYSQLEGKLSNEIQGIRDHLLHYCALLELELDFSEEDLPVVDRSELIAKLIQEQRTIEDLIATFKLGRVTREGVKLVIVGRPNVGKSSLLNALVREERAIVTEIPGTTRDPLEAQLDIQGVLFKVFDTAGIKETTDRIEQEGIHRAKQHLATADIIVHVFDGAEPLQRHDYEIINLIRQFNSRQVLRIVNKTDLPQKISTQELIEPEIPMLFISATQGFGLEKLEQQLFDCVINGKTTNFSEAIVVTNVRHWQALQKTLAALNHAIQEAEDGVSSEFITLYVREALNFLGEITGKVTSEDILNHIFSRFCIGK